MTEPGKQTRPVPHQLIAFVLDFFYHQKHDKELVPRLARVLHAMKIISDWQQLVVGIAIGCSISPIIFVAASENILIGAWQMMDGVWLPAG